MIEWATEMIEHRWSGWPGAWCLDCGCSDPMEDASALGHMDWSFDVDGNPVAVKIKPEFANLYEGRGSCPEPGSKRHDPYERPKEPPK